ncbi:hypothetical protein HY637_05265 [Candidatus Woesearchaeota archaeon]|nr:hypothetical protein [Candidatus Woesearchaeota archaeon]
MTLNKSELSRLSPEERIRKLRQLEDERKKEVDEIGKLIKDSMQELKTGKLAEDIAPASKTVDISRLFETAGGEKLERTAKQEASSAAKGTKSYQTFVQTYQDYSKLKNFYGIVSTGGNLTEEQIAAIGQIGERIGRAEKYMTESERTASKLDASRFVLYKLKKETGVD